MCACSLGQRAHHRKYPRGNLHPLDLSTVITTHHIWSALPSRAQHWFTKDHSPAKMAMDSFERLMTFSPYNPRTTARAAHRLPRLLILRFADSRTLLTLRLVSRIFRAWTKTQEYRFFREINFRIRLTDDYRLFAPGRLAALGRLGKSITNRLIITFIIPCRLGQKIVFRDRKTGEIRAGGYTSAQDGTPMLPGVFKHFESGLFRRILESMPNLTCLWIRDQGISAKDSDPEDNWGLTLVCQALIFLRAQIEEAHTNRIQRRIKLEEDLLIHDTIINRPYAEIVKFPQAHLEEIAFLAHALKLEEFSQLFRDVSIAAEQRVCRPQLQKWLMSLPRVLPEFQRQLSALTRSTKEQLISCLEISESILKEDIIRLSTGVANIDPFTPAWQRSIDQINKLKRQEPRRKILKRLEFLIDLAESPSKREQILSHLDVPLPEGPPPPPVDLDELRRLSEPPCLFSFQLDLSTPLALWYIRSTPRRDGSIGNWSSTITNLHIMLPSPTPGSTRAQRGFVKRSYHTLIAEFAPWLETLCIKFHPPHPKDARKRADADPSFRGQRVSPECPLVYFCGDLDFCSAAGAPGDGGGGPLGFPRLKRLGLINVTLRWEGRGGMREFFEAKARGCITLHLVDVVFGGGEATVGWEGLYRLFMLDNPGRPSKFGWELTRKFEETR
ncbi:uncharacterized protein LAJ45_06434 [Morchella importuna]|uniref:uncharacterized protein n=1 Tax=Morchella importuna TaxID=1174673 RepID=UPI001E8E5122|nr:uncharacterized protein LAJ45_06434 [Morchella importuna]KAH8149355.1 hypothetical protein LAJ45_06434 [Morchella importuna]